MPGLLLVRRVGESLRVGDVTFQIVRFGPGRRVTVRIKAPPHIEIVRSEIDERKEKAT